MFTINTANLGSKRNHRNITYGNQNIRHSISNHSIDGITVTIQTTNTLATLVMLVITVGINVCRSTCKGHLFLSDWNQTYIFWRDVSKTSPIYNFKKTCQVGARLNHVDSRTLQMWLTLWTVEC